MYSPGSVKLADVVVLPFSSFAEVDEKRTSPGPRYFAQRTVMPTGSPRRLGRPSSVADSERVVDVGVASTVLAASSVTTGGRFELIFSLLPPRVVRCRSICHTGFSVATTCCVCPCALSFHTSVWLPKSFGTTTRKTSLWRRGTKYVGWPRSPPGSNELFGPTARSTAS